MSNMLVLCVFGHEKELSTQIAEGESSQKSAQKKMEEQPLAKKAFVLFICFFGLQASYLTWGVLQVQYSVVIYFLDCFDFDSHITPQIA